ncbi:unnamed protein product [Thelazia callipaeda]|uniref:C2H2-type domain-containing protein n=1 Tax=Thelazia callipaeda TaxID=103827 RepID=A0A0N5DC31_THECL|nr:unnamed protein product [Thelazia callipaeda]
MCNTERMSPVSVDSGFDSSFPSSPDCSLDSLICARNMEMTKYCKDFNLKRRPSAVSFISDISQCSLPFCQPSSSSTISQTSSGIITTSSLESTDTKTNENFLFNSCIAEKSVVIASSVRTGQNSEVSSLVTLDDSLELVADYLTESSSTISCTEVLELDLKIRCRWKTCSERFACDNDLYDHVVKTHLKPLRPSDCNSKSNGGGCLQIQTKGRLKNLMCQWGKCKMGLSRGDYQKQFVWLEEHFTTRHAGKAQPYMCLIEGCSSRFTLKRLLEEHLRTGHEKAKVKRGHTEEGDLARLKSCYEWTPLPYYIPNENDFLDKATEEWIVMRLRQYERTNNACFMTREPVAPRGGAAYRKRRRILTFAIEPLKIDPKAYVIPNAIELANAKSLFKNTFIPAKNPKDCVTETKMDTN